MMRAILMKLRLHEKPKNSFLLIKNLIICQKNKKYSKLSALTTQLKMILFREAGLKMIGSQGERKTNLNRRHGISSIQLKREMLLGYRMAQISM